MDRLPDDDPDTFTKTVHHSFQHGTESLCRELSDGAVARVKGQFLRKFLQDYNTAIQAYDAKMKAMALYVRTKLDEAEAERLCRATVLDRQALGQAILDPLLSHCCKKEGLMISPTLSRYMPEPITLDSDSDSDDAEESDASDDEAAAQAGHHLPTPNNPRASHRKRERTHDNRPNSPESQPRSVQRAYEEPPDVYDIPSPEAASNPVLIRDTDNGTIQSFMVEGEDFIFPYPAMGPGYYVVRCDRAIHMYQLDEDPFRLWGGTNVLVKHFARKCPKPTCHRRKHAKIYTTDQIVMKFGYRVVDDEGADVTAEWVEASNERVVSNVDRDSVPKGKQAEGKHAKGKRKAPADPATPPGRPAYGPSSRGRCTSRGGSASRRRLRRMKVPAWSTGSGAGDSATGVEAAGPSESRGPVFVADMIDIGELWSAQVAGTSSSNWNWNHLGEGGDTPPARVESDLNPAE